MGQDPSVNHEERDLIITIGVKMDNVVHSVSAMEKTMQDLSKSDNAQWRKIDRHGEALQWLTKGFWTILGGSGFIGFIIWAMRQ